MSSCLWFPRYRRRKLGVFLQDYYNFRKNMSSFRHNFKGEGMEYVFGHFEQNFKGHSKL